MKLWDRFGPIRLGILPILQTQAGRAAVLEVFSTRELIGEFTRRGGIVRAGDRTCPTKRSTPKSVDGVKPNGETVGAAGREN